MFFNRKLKNYRVQYLVKEEYYVKRENFDCKAKSKRHAHKLWLKAINIDSIFGDNDRLKNFQWMKYDIFLMDVEKDKFWLEY